MSDSDDDARMVSIVVPVYGRVELAVRCLAAIDQTTAVDVPVLVLDDCGPERVPYDLIGRAVTSGRLWRLVTNDVNLGFVRTANKAFTLLTGQDVVLVNSDVEVLPGWWGSLTRAAGDRGVASASALTNEGTILSVPAIRALRGADAQTVDRVVDAAGVRGRSARIPVAVGHCVYFNRAALDAVGPFDEVYSPGYGEEVDWSLRARRGGWHHVAALDSLVLHEGEGSFGATHAQRRGLIRRHEARVAARFPREFIGIRAFARNRRTDLWQAKRRLSLAAEGIR